MDCPRVAQPAPVEHRARAVRIRAIHGAAVHHHIIIRNNVVHDAVAAASARCDPTTWTIE